MAEENQRKDDKRKMYGSMYHKPKDSYLNFQQDSFKKKILTRTEMGIENRSLDQSASGHSSCTLTGNECHKSTSSPALVQEGTNSLNTADHVM
jgi:hypothetical protein